MGIDGVTGESDGILVGRVLAGDTDAYAGLVGRYRDRLGRYAMRMLGNSADAEDALQETFVRGYKHLARCSSPDRFGAWMFGILVNRCRTLGSGNECRQVLPSSTFPERNHNRRLPARPVGKGYRYGPCQSADSR